MTRGDTAATMPGAALGWLVAGYEALGFELEGDMNALGITPEAVRDDPQARVPLATYGALLGRALARDPAFAVTAGHRCAFGTFPLLDCTTAACATLRASLQALDRYFALVTGNGRWVLSGCVLELVPSRPLPEWLRVASFEFGLHYTAARIDELAGRVAVRGLEVSWAAPAWAPRYPRPTLFGAPRAALVLEAEALDMPSRRADPIVAALLSRSASSLLASLPAASSVRGRVHAVVVALMPQGLPQMAEVARALDTTPRTLRRWLAAEGLTFEGVRDEALSAIARDRLADPRSSVAEIAYLLGFSELRAFQRAFKRWTGRTPGEYRRSLRG